MMFTFIKCTKCTQNATSLNFIIIIVKKIDKLHYLSQLCQFNVAQANYKLTSTVCNHPLKEK